MYQKERNRISNGEWALVKTEEFTIFQNFDCGDNDLNEYINHDAEKHRSELLAETYYLTEATVDENFPVAFISYCNDSIQLSKEARSKLLPQGKQYPFLPAVKIARLGVRAPFQRKDIGSMLINMTRDFFLNGNRTGCRFMTVDSYNNSGTVKFYEKNGFLFLTDKDKNKGTRSMYFDLKRMIA